MLPPISNTLTGFGFSRNSFFDKNTSVKGVAENKEHFTRSSIYNNKQFTMLYFSEFLFTNEIYINLNKNLWLYTFKIRNFNFSKL